MSASLWVLGTSRADQMRLIFPLRYMQMKGWRQKMLENKKDRIPEGIRSGTPEGTRTPDLLIRSQSLYPTELPAHFVPLSRALRYNIMDFRKCQALFFTFLKKFCRLTEGVLRGRLNGTMEVI